MAIAETKTTGKHRLGMFSALGFYPVAPATNQYVIGSPLFNEVTLQLQNGNTFTISASNNAMDHPYIQSARLNGKPFDQTFISTQAIQQGGNLEFNMGKEPNKNWAVSEAAKPYSLSNEK